MYGISCLVYQNPNANSTQPNLSWGLHENDYKPPPPPTYPPTTHTNSIPAITQLYSPDYDQTSKVGFRTYPLTDQNCTSNICLGNICPANIYSVWSIFWNKKFSQFFYPKFFLFLLLLSFCVIFCPRPPATRIMLFMNIPSLMVISTMLCMLWIKIVLFCLSIQCFVKWFDIHVDWYTQ